MQGLCLFQVHCSRKNTRNDQAVRDQPQNTVSVPAVGIIESAAAPTVLAKRPQIPNDRQAAQSPRSQRGGGILLVDVKCACLVARNLQPDRGYQVATYDFRMIETRQLSGRNNASRIKQLSGAPAAIRTRDLCLRRAALYPAELRVRRPRPRTVGVDGRNLAKALAVRNRRFGEHAGLAPFPPKRKSTSSPPRLGPGPAGPTAWACRWRG